MRSRVLFIASLLVVVVLAIPSVTHAEIPFFRPIIPTDDPRCAANWTMLIVVINNLISLAITIIIVFIAPIMIAYSGFLFVSNPYNVSGLSQAKSILQNTIVGIVVSLAAWMIVGALMAVLYDRGSVGQTWETLITGSGDLCLEIAEVLNQVEPGVSISGIDASGQAILNFDPNEASSGACSAAALKRAVPSLTTAEAKTFACLAKYESTCGTRMKNYSWDKPDSEGKASTAYGAFQVTLSSNNACYENSACAAAAGISETEKLNCQKGFAAKGFTKGGDPEVLDRCTKAASNLACSTAAAACLLKTPKGFNNWTTDKDSSGQIQCIAKYAGGANN